MSTSPFGENPYTPPGPAFYPEKTAVAPWVEKPSGPWQMNYFGAFEMIHRNPDWFVNALLMFVCAIIPVIGGIVLNGYVYETIEVLHRTNGTYYPKFDFNRFVEYLLRGVGPFLVGLIFGTIVAFLVILGYVLIFASIFAAGAAGEGNKEIAGIGILAGFAVYMLVLFAASLVINFLVVPLGLRGGLSSDIGQSFNFGWAWDFIKKTWLEMLLAFLFQFGVGIVLELVILATCGVGVLALPVALGYIFLISAWLQFQLYRVFLSRGGEPIPFKPAPLPLPMS
jgi:hypothetical protein